MPQVKLNFKMNGWADCTVEVPQSVIDEYNRLCNEIPGDGRAIDNLLEPYVNYNSVMEQLEEAEDIELELADQTA